MSRRRFLGWEPAQVLTHEYDDAGRLVRSVRETEPEWDEENRSYVLAQLLLEQDRCPGCSQPLSESLEVGGNDPEYTAKGLRCASCEAVYHYTKGCTDEQLRVLRITTSAV